MFEKPPSFRGKEIPSGGYRSCLAQLAPHLALGQLPRYEGTHRLSREIGGRDARARSKVSNAACVRPLMIVDLPIWGLGGAWAWAWAR